MRARYYDASIGRFSSFDTYLGDTSSPISLHKYFYANDNPIYNSDPTGRFVGLLDTLSTASIQTTLASVQDFVGGWTMESVRKRKVDLSYPLIAVGALVGLAAAGPIMSVVGEFIGSVAGKAAAGVRWTLNQTEVLAKLATRGGEIAEAVAPYLVKYRTYRSSTAIQVIENAKGAGPDIIHLFADGGRYGIEVIRRYSGSFDSQWLRGAVEDELHHFSQGEWLAKEVWIQVKNVKPRVASEAVQEAASAWTSAERVRVVVADAETGELLGFTIFGG